MCGCACFNSTTMRTCMEPFLLFFVEEKRRTHTCWARHAQSVRNSTKYHSTHYCTYHYCIFHHTYWQAIKTCAVRHLLSISSSLGCYQHSCTKCIRPVGAKRNNSKMEQVQNLPPHQQQQFMQHLEQMQMKDSLTYVQEHHIMIFCSFRSWAGISILIIHVILFLSFSIECTTIWSFAALIPAHIPSVPSHLTSTRLPASKIAHQDILRWHNVLAFGFRSTRQCNSNNRNKTAGSDEKLCGRDIHVNSWYSESPVNDMLLGLSGFQQKVFALPSWLDEIALILVDFIFKCQRLCLDLHYFF